MNEVMISPNGFIIVTVDIKPMNSTVMKSVDYKSIQARTVRR